MKLALFHTGIRGDEKLLIQAAKKERINLKLLDIRQLILDPLNFAISFDLVLMRSISAIKASHVTQFLESLGVKVVNNYQVSSICQDKFATCLALQKAAVPTPKFGMAFDLNQALALIDSWGGFPVVAKPTLGSWGRLLSKINDRQALETILEHKTVLGSVHHQAFYFQEYIKKPGRDIRAFVIGGQVVAAIYRYSDHWITNTALGGQAKKCEINQDLEKICARASLAIGGGILAMDVFETSEGLKINEVNHSMEFKNSEGPTGVSISGEVINYLKKIYAQS